MPETQYRQSVSPERFAARQRINELLRSRGWSIDSLARAAKRDRGTTKNLINGSNPSAAGRAAIEAALGEKIWNVPQPP